MKAVLVGCLLALVACSGGGGGADVARGPGPGPGPTSAPTTTVPAGPPVAAETPEALAAQLILVETAIRNPSTPPAEMHRLGHFEQVLTRALVSHAEWQGDVFARLPPNVKPIVEANLLAGTELRRLSSGEPHGIPDWKIVAPPPPATLLAEYKAAEAATGVGWHYLAAIHLVETRMGRIRGDSSAGAQGPMQFIPSTWAAYGGGGDINSYHDAILAAARLLKANGAPDDMNNALYRYNPSQRYVRAITAYADQMKSDERAYLAYYHWQVYYFDTLLPEGYGS